MSDTPETDALAFAAFDGQGGDEVVFANLARRFERERNKAEAGWLECRNFAQRIVDERDRYKSEVEVITRERDEALNKAHNYEQGYLTHAARADTLEKERDEAREALADISRMDTSGLAAPAVSRALRSLGEWTDILDAKTTQDLRQNMEAAK